MTANTLLRTLIVDDEPLGRERVRALCEQLEEIDVIGEACDGSQALALIEELHPDLVFLDIQMPELDGIAVAEAVGAEALPVVVFVTAYDAYALRAFDLHAVDYLLKPFDFERFRTAVIRARERHAAGRDREVFEPLFAELRERPPFPNRLSVRNRDTIRLIKIDDIDWIASAGNYVELHVGEETHLLRQTMTSMENNLDPSRFIRIHRSAIVNLERIKQISAMFKGEYQVQLYDGTRLTLSRSYKDRLDAFSV